MEMKDYKILTEGRFVAGIRNPGKGETVKLTDLQAEHPLRTLEIELVPTKAAVVEPEPPKPVAAKPAEPAAQ